MAKAPQGRVAAAIGPTIPPRPFSLRPPSADQGESPPAPKRGTSVEVSGMARSGEKLRILIIEDDDDVAGIIRGAIQRRYTAWSLFRARNGQEAQSLISNGAEQRMGFDLIVSDWVIPGKSGFELLKSVRAHAATAATPFLMVTGCSHDSMMPMAQNAGVSGFLAKPFTEEELLATVDEIMQKHTVAVEAG
jgi:DNA-binding response OmpR family regulator